MGRETINEIDDGEIHTWVSFITGILAIGIMSYVGIKYIGSEEQYDKSFGIWAFIHAFYTFCGLFVAPVIMGKSLIPQKPIKVETVKHSVILFLATVWFQFFVSMLSVSNTDRKLYHIFSGVSEEMFYRAFLIPFFIYVVFAEIDNERLKKILAVFSQALLFAGGHINYWDDPIAMLAAFGSGLIFGGFYVLWQDLTANISVHMVNNVIASGVFSV